MTYIPNCPRCSRSMTKQDNQFECSFCKTTLKDSEVGYVDSMLNDATVQEVRDYLKNLKTRDFGSGRVFVDYDEPNDGKRGEMVYLEDEDIADGTIAYDNQDIAFLFCAECGNDVRKDLALVNQLDDTAFCSTKCYGDYYGA